MAKIVKDNAKFDNELEFVWVSVCECTCVCVCVEEFRMPKGTKNYSL